MNEAQREPFVKGSWQRVSRLGGRCAHRLGDGQALHTGYAGHTGRCRQRLLHFVLAHKRGITMSDLDLIAYIFCGGAILGVVYTMIVDRRARKRKAKR